MIMHIPVVGNIIIYNEMTMFSKTFATLINNNIFITDSMDILGRITDNEIYGLLASNLMTNEAIMKKSLVDLVELNKERKEKDNITAMLLKVI